MSEHVCCFHTWRIDSYGNARVEAQRCCYCPAERRVHAELRPRDGHGPYAPSEVWVTTKVVL